MPHKKNNRSLNKVEAQNEEDINDSSMPRFVARAWGLVAGISYISNGGYLLVQADSKKCKGAGGYMIIIGLLIILAECACCLCPVKNNIFERAEKKVPFWLRGVVYILIIIPVVSLCFGVKTLISSVIVIMLGLLYILISCIVRISSKLLFCISFIWILFVYIIFKTDVGSKKYERLQGEANQRIKEQKRNYNTVSQVSNVMSALKKNAAQNQNKERRQYKPRKHKPRSVSTNV